MAKYCPWISAVLMSCSCCMCFIMRRTIGLLLDEARRDYYSGCLLIAEDRVDGFLEQC